MQAEHARIDPVLKECTEGFTRLAEGTTEAVRLALGRSLAVTSELLNGRLGQEERDAMAPVPALLVHADWVRVQKEHFRPASAHSGPGAPREPRRRCRTRASR